MRRPFSPNPVAEAAREVLKGLVGPGLRFRSLNREASSASCGLTHEDLERIIAGRNLPSAAEIFGAPLGHQRYPQ